MTNTMEYKFLPLTLSMETIGGVSTPLVKRGTPLPVKRRQRFSTASDNQKAITISVFCGESPISNKNILLGKVDLDGIPEAPRGGAEIDVRFEVSQQVQIKVIATVVKSGKAISSITKGFCPDLTNNKVDEMLRKANDERQEDLLRAQQVDARNTAGNLLHHAEQYLQGQQQYGIQSSVDTQIEEVVGSLGLSLQDDNIGAVMEKSKLLQELIPPETSNLGDLFSRGGFDNVFGYHQTPKKKPAFGGKTKASGISSKKPFPTEEIVPSRGEVFSAGQYFDAKRVVRDLFSAATRELIIVDAYVGEDVINLLTIKRDGVCVKLLTSKISPVVLTLARDFNRQYKNLEIRTSKMFHDRFIFVDDKDFYHFGASLEHLGNKTFMYSKLEEPLIIKELKKHWCEGWGQAIVVL